MKVEIWSDFISPHCYIGKRNFELALEKFNQKRYVKIEFKSFQLIKEKNRITGTLTQLLMDMYDLKLDEVNTLTKKMCKQAASVGLPMCLEDIKKLNTMDAHRLVKFAEKKGKALEVVDLLFRHYFGVHDNIADLQILLGIAKKCGLDEKEVAEVLSVQRYSNAVQYDEEIALEIGVKDIPFFVFNETYALVGNQSVEAFLEILQTSWKEDEQRLIAKQTLSSKTVYCEGDQCDRKWDNNSN